MATIAIESIPIMVGREEDGRWWADIESMPGVMAYGETRELAIAAVRALALRVAADCIEHGEEIADRSLELSLFRHTALNSACYLRGV
ncbi:MAG: type II toxin-antitoxin system HicB family antitoxin [Acidobacteriota bacterium]|nr:type II toxin-antitoxin system HicB family antitoxin [Acidobacteriota bacterium]